MARYELLAAGEVQPDPKWRMPPHLHANHEVILVKNGSMVLKTSGGEILATPGAILFYHAGLIHEEISDSANPVNSLFMAFRTREDLRSFPLVSQDSEGRITELLTWLVRDCRRGRPVKDCQSIIQTVIDEMKWRVARPGDSWHDGIRAHMRSKLATPLSLAGIARHGGMSRFAFVRKFKRLGGRTPMEDLRLMRLNEARNLILSSGLPLKAIASAVGIGDEYQLSKLFRRHYGITPREMRTKA